MIRLLLAITLFFLNTASLHAENEHEQNSAVIVDADHAQLDKAQQALIEAEHAIVHCTQNLKSFVGKQQETMQSIKKARETAKEIQETLNQFSW